MSNFKIAIDPGANGGIAFSYQGKTDAVAMPDTDRALSDILENLVMLADGEGLPIRCVIEDVHAMPGQGVTSMFSFGRNVGLIHGILAALRIPYKKESPQSWQKKLGNLPKDKAERKKKLKETAQAMFPELKVTLKTADALCILLTMEQVCELR